MRTSAGVLAVDGCDHPSRPWPSSLVILGLSEGANGADGHLVRHVRALVDVRFWAAGVKVVVHHAERILPSEARCTSAITSAGSSLRHRPVLPRYTSSPRRSCAIPLFGHAARGWPGVPRSASMDRRRSRRYQASRRRSRWRRVGVVVFPEGTRGPTTCSARSRRARSSSPSRRMRPWCRCRLGRPRGDPRKGTFRVRSNTVRRPLPRGGRHDGVDLRPPAPAHARRLGGASRHVSGRNTASARASTRSPSRRASRSPDPDRGQTQGSGFKGLGGF